MQHRARSTEVQTRASRIDDLANVMLDSADILITAVKNVVPKDRNLAVMIGIQQRVREGFTRGLLSLDPSLCDAILTECQLLHGGEHATEPVAGVEPPVFTVGLLNGRGWKDLAPHQRATYVLGAIHIAMTVATAQCEMYFTNGLAVGDLVREVDEFYRNAANDNVPVTEAFRICAMPRRGVEPERVDAFIKFVRVSSACVHFPKQGTEIQ